MNSLISIIIPTYNRSNILKYCLESVSNQDYNNYEVLIIDDNSSEDLSLITNLYDERFRLIKNYRSKGAQGARNCGIEKSNGEFIVFLDSDDTLSLNSISKRINCFELDKNIGLIYGNLDYRNYPLVLNSKEWMNRNLTLCAFSAMMVPKIVFDEIGLMSEKLLSYQDDYLCFKISRKYNFKYCNTTVANFAPNSRETNISSNWRKQYNGLIDYIKFVDEFDISKNYIYHLFKIKRIILKYINKNDVSIYRLALKILNKLIIYDTRNQTINFKNKT